MTTITPEQIADFIAGGGWRGLFDAAALEAGARLARSRLVTATRGEILADTGDAEITSRVSERDGATFDSTIALWLDDSGLAIDASCSCDVAANCRHNVATLERLSHPQRAAAAFGVTPAPGAAAGPSLDAGLAPSHPQRDAAARSRTAASGSGEGGADSEARTDAGRGADPGAGADLEVGGPTFLLRVENRPPDDARSEWLPPTYARAFAVYRDAAGARHQAPLDPAGNLKPLASPAGNVFRDRAAEMAELQALYAIDLMPGAEQPPAVLRKVRRPAQQGALWAPDRQAWPHPEFYWQRFRHEAVPALERRGWTVEFAPDVGYRPLVFRTDGWSAEIVEEGRGWFNLSAGFEIDGERFDLQPILATLVEHDFLEATDGMPPEREFMVFLPDGRGLALPVGRFRNILTTLGQLLQFKFTDSPLKVSKLDAAALTQAAELGADAPPELETIAKCAADPAAIEPVDTPAGLRAQLRHYQVDGFRWMQFLARSDLNGILADDMGLGKTLQLLTHVLAERESGRDEGRPSLVVAPTSVVENWQREAAKFAPSLRCLILQGAARHDRFAAAADADLVLTSYALLHRDLHQLAEHEFHILALDEAQHIKNPDTKVGSAVRQLRSRHRLCLSGTPVENHLGELWSLMDFLMPGLLGTAAQFNETYRVPIERNGSTARARALSQRVGPLILRRAKNDVAKELPPKTEVIHTIELSEPQKDLYETVRATMDRKVRDALALRGTESQVVFLDALMKLRQICCHPELIRDQSHTSESAKFDFLKDLLATLRREGHRVLVFSQFTSMLAIIERHLARRRFRYLKLTGDTPNSERQTLVERFQSGDAEVLLISLKAGGTGLTLTGADTVIHYDPWWNPAAENQATDRAYRIGQDKPVIVHKLICSNTVEQRIQQMQGKKDDLASDVLSGALQSLTLTPETLEALLAPHHAPS